MCSKVNLTVDRQVLCDQNCGLHTKRGQTDRNTDTGTDKKVKTEGPKIFSNYIFYFKTVIIGGPIHLFLLRM